MPITKQLSSESMLARPSVPSQCETPRWLIATTPKLDVMSDDQTSELKGFFFGIANGLTRLKDLSKILDSLIAILSRIGPFNVKDVDFTTQGICEKIFQAAFRTLSGNQNYDGQKLRVMIKWLLDRGQPPDTLIEDELRHQKPVTALQIALGWQKIDIALDLLHSGANPYCRQGFQDPSSASQLVRDLWLLVEDHRLHTWQSLVRSWALATDFAAELKSTIKFGRIENLRSIISQIDVLRHPFYSMVLREERGDFVSESWSVPQDKVEFVSEYEKALFIDEVNLPVIILDLGNKGLVKMLQVSLEVFHQQYPHKHFSELFTPAVILASSNCRESKSVMSYLMDMGIDPNTSNSKGISALHAAARFNNLDVCQLLLNQGASPDVISTGPSPLHLAALYADCEVLNLLHSFGADIHKSVSEDVSEKFFGSLIRREKKKARREARFWDEAEAERFRRMMDLCCTPSGSALTAAQIDYYHSSWKFFAAQGMSLLTHYFPEEFTVCDGDRVKSLLEQGADPNQKARDGQSALQVALKLGCRHRGCWHLLNAGAKVMGGEAIMAVQRGMYDVCFELLEREKQRSTTHDWEDGFKITFLEAVMRKAWDFPGKNSSIKSLIFHLYENTVSLYSPVLLLLAICLEPLDSIFRKSLIQRLIRSRPGGSDLCFPEHLTLLACCFRSDITTMVLLFETLPMEDFPRTPQMLPEFVVESL